MTTLDDSPRNDLSLVADVRDGWRDAFGELYRRHHGPALRFALMLTGGDEAQAQDLVAEAFARVLRATSAGGGSTVAFRPYLLSAVRHEYLAELRRSGRVDLVENADELDGMSPNGTDGDERFDDSTITTAFRRLPARWREVLWHTEIKGDKPADIAPLMGISPNAAAALAARAREGLRQEYLQEHVAGARRECWPYASRLARFVRGALSPREQQLVESHMRHCADCSRARSELRGLNGRMRTVLPVIVGAGAMWPGPGLPSLSGLPAAAGGGSSWMGSVCVAGTGAVVAPASVATTTASVGVVGVVTTGFAKVAATAAAVVASSAAAFGFAAGPAPADSQAGDSHAVMTPTASATELEGSPRTPAETATGAADEGALTDESAAAAGGDVSGDPLAATSSLTPAEQAAHDGGLVGEAGGAASAEVSTGESPTASTPAAGHSSGPTAGAGTSPEPGQGRKSAASGSPSTPLMAPTGEGTDLGSGTHPGKATPGRPDAAGGVGKPTQAGLPSGVWTLPGTGAPSAGAQPGAGTRSGAGRSADSDSGSAGASGGANVADEPAAVDKPAGNRPAQAQSGGSESAGAPAHGPTAPGSATKGGSSGDVGKSASRSEAADRGKPVSRALVREWRKAQDSNDGQSRSASRWMIGR